MKNRSEIVHSLWIGDKLSPLELLTLYSFVDKGFIFYLWVYKELDNKLPKEVILKDANEIIPQIEVYAKNISTHSNNFGIGSYAPFSDLFRYKLLFEYGGWWVDMDITCLEAFDVKEPYYFRAHPILPMIGNVMKCPPQSDFLKRTYDEVKKPCNTNTRSWLLSNEILNRNIAEANLSHYIVGGESNQDDWLEIERILYGGHRQKMEWKFIHWMNEEWRTREINKNAYYKNSYLGVLYQQYSIEAERISIPRYLRIRYYVKLIYRKVINRLKSILQIA